MYLPLCTGMCLHGYNGNLAIHNRFNNNSFPIMQKLIHNSRAVKVNGIFYRHSFEVLRLGYLSEGGWYFRLDITLLT